MLAEEQADWPLSCLDARSVRLPGARASVGAGIINTDFTTQKRTPKLSARWYAQVMKENRIL